MARAVTIKSFNKVCVVANVAYPLVEAVETAAGHKPTTVYLRFVTPQLGGTLQVGDKYLLTTGGLTIAGATTVELYDVPMNSKEFIHFDMTKMYVTSTVAGDSVRVIYYAFVD